MGASWNNSGLGPSGPKPIDNWSDFGQVHLTVQIVVANEAHQAAKWEPKKYHVKHPSSGAAAERLSFTDDDVDVLFRRRSLLSLSGAARYLYRHGVGALRRGFRGMFVKQFRQMDMIFPSCTGLTWMENYADEATRLLVHG